MNTKGDLDEIVQLINECLPEFSACKENFLNLTPGFTTAFYHAYLNELKKEWQNLFPNIPADNITFNASDADQERYLCLFIRYILNIIGIQYFTVSDFYRPTNRTKTTIKILLFYLSFFKMNSQSFQMHIEHFNDAVNKKKSQEERILILKNRISDLSCEIGLKKENIHKLKKEYDQELELESKLKEEGTHLDEETKELQEQVASLSRTLALEEKKRQGLLLENKTLSSCIVPYEEYELCRASISQLKQTIKGVDQSIALSDKILEEKLNEQKHFKECHSILSQIDMSVFKHIDDIENLKLTIEDYNRKLSTTMENKEKLHKTIQMKMQNINLTEENFQKEKEKMEDDLLRENEECLLLFEKIKVEKELQEKLRSKMENMMKELESSEKECKKFEEEEKLLKDTHEECYKELLNQQNIFADSLVSKLKGLMEKYK